MYTQPLPELLITDRIDGKELNETRKVYKDKHTDMLHICKMEFQSSSE